MSLQTFAHYKRRPEAIASCIYRGFVTPTIERASSITVLFWLFTKDDFDTFVIPNVTFGMVSALAEAAKAENSGAGALSIIGYLLSRLPTCIFFNWTNLLIFDLANQRLPESIVEDRLNKPWRPLPRALLTPNAVARIMLVALPSILATSYAMGTAVETSLLFVLTWMYNDLHGGDESWILRNMIIAAAFFLYNLGSAKVACGPSIDLGPTTFYWAIVISGVIFTTMHVQDFKDQVGDKARNRHTAPLVLGDGVARWTFAIPVMFWSITCTLGAGVGAYYSLVALGLGSLVAWRSLFLRDRVEDRRTWKLWCLWCVMIYGVPLAKVMFKRRTL